MQKKSFMLQINHWNVNIGNIVISKLNEKKKKTNSKYFIGYLDKFVRSIVLIYPKISGYVKTFKVKDGDKDKNNKLMSFCINYEKLLEKYNAIWTNIEDLKNIKLNALPVYDEQYKNEYKQYKNQYKNIHQ